MRIVGTVSVQDHKTPNSFFCAGQLLFYTFNYLSFYTLFSSFNFEGGNFQEKKKKKKIYDVTV